MVFANKVRMTWCQHVEDNQWDPSLLYGNDASPVIFYQVASILIVVPIKKYTCTTKRLSAGSDTNDLHHCSVNNALEFP